MANRAYLISHNQDRPISYGELTDDCVLAASNYRIPILWLALFTSDDIVRTTVEMADDNGLVTQEEYPVLVVRTQQGKQRIIHRRARLWSVLPTELSSFYEEFVAFLDTVATDYIEIETCGIWMMEPTNFAEKLKTYLSAFDSNRMKDWNEVLKQSAMEVKGIFKRIIYDPKTAGSNMRGHKWVQPVPWQD